jgi:subtilisin family serine protease
VAQFTNPTTIVDLASVVNPSNDTLYNLQWAPKAINAPGAWAAGYTGAGVRVAVIDGGMFVTHPDLAGNIDTASARSFVTDGVPGLGGCPATAYDCDTGTFWHATHVAGIIAARDNNTGVVGIAPQATIVPVKALHNGSGSFGAIIAAIMYAATDGRADIINMSLGAVFARNDPGAAELRSALNRAVNFASAQGALVVVAAGNDALDLDHSGNLTDVPAESGNAIAIAATAPIGWAKGATNFSTPASYTNYGNSAIWVSAPGGDEEYPGNENCTVAVVGGTVTVPCFVLDLVLSTSRAGYSWAGGTSMAAPHVAAVAALIKQKNPGANPAQLKAKLAQSADDVGKNGHDPFSGRGFLDAAAAVAK